ncbi:MAG: phosphomethylpyrimidine synthase ThiC [Methanomicrobiales archaeon]|nr:phosphomethylpyrimidine synthase ThiC [Methanomicrobiales archaeon]
MNGTLLERARSGAGDEAIRAVARSEGVRPELLRKQVASGRAVIVQREGKRPVGIGEGLRTKINANIGTSTASIDPEEEVRKANIAEELGADTITDLSMGGPIDEIRAMILEATGIPLTTVPMYQAVVEAGSIKNVTVDRLIGTVRRHVREGISLVVVHAGFTLGMLRELASAGRVMGMVSRGGCFTAAWMLLHRKENPFISRFDDICEILADNDAVLSLGNPMRSGCIHDSMDRPQEGEIALNAALARRANDHGVQVIVEGAGGHVHPARIPEYIAHYKQKTDGRPLFVAGPLPTDISAGYDHIAACVGGALAAGAGADYLCYITPSEHLALPNAKQVREGVVACRIAAHIGDTMKYGLREGDRMMAVQRRARNWEEQFRLAIDGGRAREIHRQDNTPGCSMCGNYCALEIMERFVHEF